MTEHKTITAYGTLIEPDTLKIERLLPGPIERVWSYLTDADLRRQWLAAGVMEEKVDAPFEFIWRNDELTTPPGDRPDGFAAEHRMQSRITELDPPRRLVITWGADGTVTFELQPQGNEILLTLTHRRLPGGPQKLMIGAGWHMHLDLLVARVSGAETEPFWDGWSRLRTEYDERMSA